MAKSAKGKATSTIPSENLELYEKLIATFREMDRKGDVHPYTSFNGHMFTYLDQSGVMGMRLPKTEVEGFLTKYKTTVFKSYGVVKKTGSLCRMHFLRTPKSCSTI